MVATYLRQTAFLWIHMPKGWTPKEAWLNEKLRVRNFGSSWRFEKQNILPLALTLILSEMVIPGISEWDCVLRTVSFLFIILSRAGIKGMNYYGLWLKACTIQFLWQLLWLLGLKVDVLVITGIKSVYYHNLVCKDYQWDCLILRNTGILSLSKYN